MTRWSKKSRRSAVGTTALPTPPAPITRIRIARSVPARSRAAYDAARDRSAQDRTKRAERRDRAGHALAPGTAQRLRRLAHRRAPLYLRGVREGVADGAARRRARGRGADVLRRRGHRLDA